MYENVFLPVMSLNKAPVKTGGFCTLKLFKKEDVQDWPAVDPLTGVMADAITLKPGGVLYFIRGVDSSRSFHEEEKTDSAGPYYEMSVVGTLQGSNAANILSLQTMAFHQWGLIIEDRNGVTRMIGNEDSCARMTPKYDSGNLRDSRKHDFAFTWEHSLPAPIYTSTAFEIIIGGLPIEAGCIKKIVAGRVLGIANPAISPFVDAQLTYTNALLANKNILTFADGILLSPLNDDPLVRYAYKALAGDTINFNGGLVTPEVIQIFTVS